MAESNADIGPQFAAGDRIVFADWQAPPLPAGEYEVHLSHTLTHGVPSNTALDGERRLHFVVAGPRFGLAPSEVVGRFPPQGASGDFANALPHVLLRRATLPWERSATAGTVGQTPWLALLVLDESELKFSAQVPLSSLVTAQVGAPAPTPTPPPGTPPAPFLTLSRDPGDDTNQSVQVIEIDADLARQVLPRIDELSLLAGVRSVVDAAGQPREDGRAVVMANRLPRPGVRNLVHLVSLEHQYSGQPARHWVESLAAGSAARVRLVSLTQWDFICANDPGHFEGLLDGLTIGSFRLEATIRGPAQGPVEAGAVPVAYRMETGEQTAAWYHGPLATRLRRPALALPARHANELRLTEAATGLSDVSYAAAWTLGRLLALRDPAVGVPLNQWKRQVAHAARASQWVGTAPANSPPPPPSPLFPKALSDWFEHALGRLEAVPFSYLVPEPALLPAETICLLRVEAAWIQALVDGAFSIGRHSQAQARLDAALGAVLPAMAERSAVLLRSELVAGWPDLVVDGLGIPTGPGAPARLTRLRFERLAKDTLLVMFDGQLSQVDLHLHPQGMHFGFDLDRSGAFSKASLPLKMRSSGSAMVPGAVVPPASRVVDISGLQTDLQVNGPHDFAARMLEGVPIASFQLTEVWA